MGLETQDPFWGLYSFEGWGNQDPLIRFLSSDPELLNMDDWNPHDASSSLSEYVCCVLTSPNMYEFNKDHVCYC